MKRLSGIFLLATTSILAGDSNPEETLGLKNGRFWSHLGSVEYESVFLVGLTDGWALRGTTKTTIPGRELIVWEPGPNSTFSDLAATVTSVYKETENQPLPIGWVVMGAFAVQRGDTSRDLVFAALRKRLSQIMDGPNLPISGLDPIDAIMQFHKK
jgi:hypothetical protein